MKTIQKFYLLSLLFVLFGCSDDNTEIELFIDDELAAHFAQFTLEAEARGVTVDLSYVEAFIQNIAGSSIAGQCFQNLREPNRIVIDSGYWRRSNALEREFVVFHELGHCVLNRQHKNVINEEGFCESMMTNGTACEDNYNANTREAYLDELFGL